MDPILLTPRWHPGGCVSERPAFWDRIVEWAADSRAAIGEETHSFLYEQYARYGYPEKDIEFESKLLSQEYQRALGRLLSRVIVHTSESGERKFTPRYLGTEEQCLVLQLDVSGTAGNAVIGLGTSLDDWEESHQELVCEPRPPKHLYLCFEPGQELAEEAAEAVRQFYEGLRLHIVGGQVDAHVIAQICKVTGIADEDVSWFACERSQPPRDLRHRWGGLRADRDVTICITGRVGHSTSTAAARAAENCGVAHLKVELATDVARSLRTYALEARACN